MYSAPCEADDNGGVGWSQLDGMWENFYGGHPRLRLMQSDLRINRINARWGGGGLWCPSRSRPESHPKVSNFCFQLIKLRCVTA